MMTMDLGLVLSFFLGIAMASTSSPLMKTDFEKDEPIISIDQHSYSIPVIESIVDSRFKVLAADFQDQINTLKGKVNRLEEKKTADWSATNGQHQHEIRKRETNTTQSIRPVCENSSSFCTYFYADHPDAGRKNSNYTPVVVHNETIKEPSIKVKGIPTSCMDLQLLGHKLNGLYLIKASKASNKGAKVETVFCNFQTPTSDTVSQEVIGNVDIKTKTVHFYVQKNFYFYKERSIIPFDLARLSEGEAMNLISGVFTAPVPGIYHFEFSGVKLASSGMLDIYLQVNGVNVGHACTVEPAMKSDAATSMSASLRLKAGDRVNLSNNIHSILVDDQNHRTHFTGWLVEEDL